MEVLDSVHVTSSTASTACPSIVFGLLIDSGGYIDASTSSMANYFLLDSNASTFTITTDTTEHKKNNLLATYDLKLTAKYDGGSYTKTGLLHFTVTTTNPCS